MLSPTDAEWSVLMVNIIRPTAAPTAIARNDLLLSGGGVKLISRCGVGVVMCGLSAQLRRRLVSDDVETLACPCGGYKECLRISRQFAGVENEGNFFKL